MNPPLKLFSTLTGSHLYGTNTPTSDLDRKVIVLPSLDDLLLCKKITNKVKQTGAVQVDNQTVDKSGRTDEEQLPLQVFARDFLEGQTYALEMAFAMPMTRREWYKLAPTRGSALTCLYPYLEGVDQFENPNPAQQAFHNVPAAELLPHMVAELRHHFLTRNVKALMGYAVHQASLYSLKGARLNALTAVVELICNPNDQSNPKGTKLAAWNYNLSLLAEKHPKYIKVTEYDIGSGQMAPCMVLLEKTFPYTDTQEHVASRLKKLQETYGERAQDARANEVDWKATMHALRILDQGIRLMEVGHLEFPYRPELVKRYLSVKRGEVNYGEVVTELNEKLERLKHVAGSAVMFPELSPELRERFDYWLVAWLRKFYCLAS